MHPAKRSGELTYSHCGGDLLKVELSQGSTKCETGKSGAFNGGDTLEWSSGNIGKCSSTSFNLDQEDLHFKLISSDGEFHGEYAFRQPCHSAVLYMHAFCNQLEYAYLQHLIKYTFWQAKKHF